MPAKDTDPSLRHLINRLRFRHLQLLVTLRQAGSLHAAAGQLNQTQSALSKALGEIESAFGAELFVRSSRGLVPTARGNIAIDGAALLLQELAHLGEEVTSDPAVGVLRVGAPPFMAHGYLPQVIASLLQQSPGVRVELLEERVPALFEALLGGQLDALVTIYPPDLSQVGGQALRVEKLFDAEFAVIAAPDHVLSRSRQVRWERLSREPWVMPAQGAMLRRVIEESFQRAGLRTPVPQVESTSPVTNLRLVAAHVGIGVVPVQTLHASETAGLVRRVRVVPGLTPVPVALISRGDIANHRLTWLREALASIRR